MQYYVISDPVSLCDMTALTHKRLKHMGMYSALLLLIP